ncbi:MAG: hypothetical protein RBS01_02000 [Candidatus Dojkabacteria bacterium]|jgi:hypothetical protein|nr:hypothetical protein [Candidatus Dojkabacteria bacterium]
MNIFEYIFPKQCIICSKVGNNICNSCIKDLPYTLPSCFICNKLNNGYYTHKDCLEEKIQCFTGWYLSEELRKNLKRQTDLGIYSTHTQLLEILISHLRLNEVVESSNIYPIKGDDKNEDILNMRLARSISKSEGIKSNTLLVGNRIVRKESLIEQVKGLYTEPFHLRILILFESTIPEPQ